METAIGYIRVSTEEQSREGVSLEMQIAKIKAYADLNDLNLVAIYGDPGISGKTIKARPGIQAVLHLVKTRKVAAVITYKLDRLSRSTVETLNMVEMIDKAGAALHSISEKLDTQSAIGRFVVRTLASLAEMERDQIAERTSAALAQKRANGEKTGGSVPTGYAVEEKAVPGRNKMVKMLIINETEQRVVRRTHNLRAEGYSLREIVRQLDQDGFRNSKGHAYGKTQVIRFLEREAA